VRPGGRIGVPFAAALNHPATAPLTAALLAMTHQRLGDAEKAAHWLARVAAKGDVWMKAEIELLRHEAQQLLGGDRP
jgi:hypothetical protein